MSASRNAVYQIPEELKAERSWVVYRVETRDGKPTKVLRRTDGRNASTVDPTTWTTFEEAVAAYQGGGFDGIGFVFHPGNDYAGVDIDDVSAEEARRWIDRFDSYAERSPSGNGIHIICKAVLPKGTNRGEGELYSSGRFFTMTGDVVHDAPISEAQEAADEFYAFLRRHDASPGVTPPTNGATPSLTDAEVVRLAENAKNGDEFSAVYKGGGRFKSASERDLSLASRLAFWTQDGAQIERIMRGSSCAREKWDKHRTYLRDTITRALSDLTETYKPSGEVVPIRMERTEERPLANNAATPTPKRPARFERIDLGEPIESGIEPPEFLVPEEVYAGRVHCVYSAGGTGKTFKALWLIKKVIQQGKPVLLLDLENGVRIISERLVDLGVTADQVRKHLHYYPFPSMPLADDASGEFEQLLETSKPALVVIDSWINCISAAGLDENSSTDIARWTDAYPQRARVRGIAVLLLDHIPKEGNTARGSGRKLDYVDAMWELRNPQKFDRDTVGRIDMHLRKDREGWLPKVLTFSVGGGPDGFVFERSMGTVEVIEDDSGLLRSDRETLEALRSLGPSGAFDKEWRAETMKRDVGRSTYYKSQKTLDRLGLVEKVIEKWFCKTPAKLESNEVYSESNRLDRPGLPEGGLSGPPTLRGGPDRPPQAETEDYDEV